MKYQYEGSNGGYPICDDRFDEYWERINSHHECSICGETRHEEAMYRTDQGWMCIDCFNAIKDDPDTLETEIPQIL